MKRDQLLDSIPSRTAADLRDKALIATMIYTFGRVSAVLNMELGDYFQEANAGGLDCMRKATSCTLFLLITAWKNTWINT